jgi:hypothetical protein
MGERPAPPAIDYPGLVTTALKGVLREVLRRAAEAGFPGDHHLFISFRTRVPGVTLPTRLRKEFPEEMTIVLQHQFWGLAVDEEAFSVQLRFGGVLEGLRVPWDALVAFADPSVPFGLSFEALPRAGEAPPEGAAAAATPAKDKVVEFRYPRETVRTGNRKPRR